MTTSKKKTYATPTHLRAFQFFQKKKYQLGTKL